MSSPVALVFPGQGSQRIGMLEALLPMRELDRLLDAAEGLSGLELGRLAAEGPAAALSDTRAAQPLLYLADWAWARMLTEHGVSHSAVAGHSLGELAALAVAGVFSVEAGLELVVVRSRLMASCAEANPGAMAAVLGMDADTIRTCISEIEGVWIANDNAPGQIVISGTAAGVESATAALQAAGARRIVALDVAGAFHSPLMEQAGREFAELLANTQFSDARVQVFQNTDPTPQTDGDRIRERLVAQITSPVRWTETMVALSAAGLSTLVEAGPGSVLSGLAKRVDGLYAMSVESAGIDGVLEGVS